jgi:hypothetical protein
MNFYDPAKRSFRTFARLYSSTPKTACATIATSLVTGIAAMTSPLRFFKTSFALRLCAIITLTLILALFAGANFSRWSAGKEAKARSLLLVRNLFVDEKPSSLMLYAHPALFESTNELNWPSHLYYLRGRLGSLTSIDALRSTVTTPLFDTGTGESTANHTVQVTFESGPADIQITYLRSGDEWLVTQFLILADALSS